MLEPLTRDYNPSAIQSFFAQFSNYASNSFGDTTDMFGVEVR